MYVFKYIYYALLLLDYVDDLKICKRTESNLYVDLINHKINDDAESNVSLWKIEVCLSIDLSNS